MLRALRRTIPYGISCLITMISARARGESPEPLEPPPRSYWEPGKPRPFLQTRTDIGINFAKGTVSAGYGLPHWIWVGPEVFAISTIDFAAIYGGIRASTPIFDIAFGYRNNYAYRRTFFLPREHYDKGMTSEDGREHARYLAWELELSGLVPLFGGYAIWILDLDKTVDVPPGLAVYEESNRVVIDHPWLLASRTGYVYPFGKNGMFKIGAVLDAIWMSGRPAGVWRVGPVALVSVTDHLDLVGLATMTVSSPDDLGFILGTWAVAGARYRWATGERSPHFP